MKYNFNNDVPIYIQIADIITKDITGGILKPGQKIPSVREYALMFAANPNTVSKALQILEERNLIYTERTNGKFVTEEKEIISKNKEEIFNHKINEFLTDLESLGYSKEQIINKLKEMK